jgi:ubiquinone/menaquinone biosynthesis C-methylase UbiE
MPTVLDEAVEIQRRYYTDTATRYEDMHANEGAGDPFAHKYVRAILELVEAKSVLDVGTATGRGLRALRNLVPDAFLCGIEPVPALLDIARRNDILRFGSLVRGSGMALPFADASFDVVCESAVLHHVHDPNGMVQEMLRVAKKAVLIMDSNRFGQGAFPLRIAKLAMYKTGTWDAFNWIRTKGKGYRITPGDGLSYSYSVYDSYPLLAKWADRLVMIPFSEEKSSSWFHPLLTSGGVLACAIRENT